MESYTFIPFIWVPGIGLYGCVMIAWLFKWRSARAGAIILAGWILAALLVLLTSIGDFFQLSNKKRKRKKLPFANKGFFNGEIFSAFLHFAPALQFTSLLKHEIE